MSNWRSIETAPRDRRILIDTGMNIYVGIWVQNFVDEKERFSIADLENGERLIVNNAHKWAEIPQ